MESKTIHKPVVFKSYFSLFFISNTTGHGQSGMVGRAKIRIFFVFLTILK